MANIQWHIVGITHRPHVTAAGVGANVADTTPVTSSEFLDSESLNNRESE